MLDTQQTAYYLTFAAQCWLSIRLEFAGTMIVMCACMVSVLEHAVRGGDEYYAGMTAYLISFDEQYNVYALNRFVCLLLGLGGLSISFALSITTTLNWTVRMASDLEANMIAVERIQQYCKIPGEAPRSISSDESLGAWPVEGRIEFTNTKLKYRPNLPLVLKGLNLVIPARSKVGVVGRTGEWLGAAS